tara:strand:+ start:405 stop:755 length:351 start_codon:yes stop_codon:yes gene_type:complete
MTLEELRIGNKVLADDGEVLNVYGLVRTTNTNCIVHSAGGLFTYLENIVGIELTIEMLINYDFTYHEEKNHEGYWAKDNFILYEDFDGKFSWDCLVDVIYLHQLQNCYHDFIGAEL